VISGSADPFHLATSIRKAAAASLITFKTFKNYRYFSVMKPLWLLAFKADRWLFMGVQVVLNGCIGDEAWVDRWCFMGAQVMCSGEWW